jgi:1-acyl-sn-glycerol-3-phosphate acyltransferase
MSRLISRFFLWIFGWKINSTMPAEVHEKCVMICAPHTSNWDFPLAMWVMSVLKVRFRFTIKKEWMGFPLGWLMRSLGAIAIDRGLIHLIE